MDVWVTVCLCIALAQDSGSPCMQHLSCEFDGGMSNSIVTVGDRGTCLLQKTIDALDVDSGNVSYFLAVSCSISPYTA